MNEDILYGAGSDDFRGYVWKIPELSTLLGFRQEISADEWMTREWTGACGEFLDSSQVISIHLSWTPAYSESQWATRYIPLQIDTPLCRLNGVKFNDRSYARLDSFAVFLGHRSIVNAVAIHPSLLHIVTSGIERHVFLHSPTPVSPVAPQLSETPPETRKLGESSIQDSARYRRALLLGPHPTLHEENEAGDEEEAISLFDQ